MFHPAALVAFTLGCVAVVQASLNRRIAGQIGLAPTVLMNGVIVAVCAGAFYVAARRGWITGMVAGDTRISWWWFVPGVLGFALITGLPWAIARVGALQVFVVAVAAQMVASLAWDALIEGIPINALRATGAAVCVAGVALALYGSSR